MHPQQVLPDLSSSRALYFVQPTHAFAVSVGVYFVHMRMMFCELAYRVLDELHDPHVVVHVG